MKAALLASLSSLTLAACMTSTTTQESPGLERAVLTPVPAVRAWIVSEVGVVRGSVVRYAERGRDGRFLYVVRNVWDQDLGMIDENGRAWRRTPHGEDRWLGTGTVESGVRSILDVGEATQLVERPIEDVEAATRSGRGE